MEVVARGWLRFIILMVMTTMAVSAAIESPTYTVVHSESDFEIRVIRSSVWVSATVDEISFDQATQLGFHRLVLLSFPWRPFHFPFSVSLHTRADIHTHIGVHILVEMEGRCASDCCPRQIELCSAKFVKESSS
jgi:hypothetical protein